MANKWKKGSRSDKTHKVEQRQGKSANNCVFENAHEIERHYHYNGSGRDSFGGAKQWPALKVHISFCVGEEKKRDALAKKIKALIDAELP